MGRPVRAIETISLLESLRALLAGRPRDLLLLDMFTQTGLPAGELLALRVGQVTGLAEGRAIKTKNGLEAVMTAAVRRDLDEYLARTGLEGGDWLFKSRKGNGPLSLTSVSHLVRGWFNQAGLEGLTGVKSLRKTWELHFKPGGLLAEIKPTSGMYSLGQSAPLGQVTASPLREKVRTRLVRAIVSGRLAPGQRLLIKKIAAEMGVSSMPVRDALARLEASGFVSWTASRTYVVKPLAWEQFAEVARLRKMLEPMAAQATCRLGSPETYARLEAANERLQRVVDRDDKTDVDEVMELNREFHLGLYGGSNMPVLLEMINGLWDKVSPYLYLVARESRTYNLAGDGQQHHREMLAALTKGDCQALGRWVETDIDYSARIALEEFSRAEGEAG